MKNRLVGTVETDPRTGRGGGFIDDIEIMSSQLGPDPETPQRSVDELVKFYGDLQQESRESEAWSSDTHFTAEDRVRGGVPSTSPVGGPGGTAATGEAFLAAYYECLSTDLGSLASFYFEDAVMTLQYDDENHGAAAAGQGRGAPLSPIGREIVRQPVVEGREAIGKRLLYIYGGRRARVTSMDCQVSSKGTMLLVASGTLEHNPSVGEGDGTYGVAPFVQSFIVSRSRDGEGGGEGGEFKITNDILRRSEPPIAQSVPQLADSIGTPVIGAGRAGAAAEEEATPEPLRRARRSQKSGKKQGGSSTHRRRRRDRKSRPTPKRLFQPVSLAAEGLGGGGAEGQAGGGGGNNLAALMAFIASLCEVLVNSVWSAVAILHVVGTLSLLLSVSAMFLKSRGDLMALDRRAAEMESSFWQDAAAGGQESGPAPPDPAMAAPAAAASSMGSGRRGIGLSSGSRIDNLAHAASSGYFGAGHLDFELSSDEGSGRVSPSYTRSQTSQGPGGLLRSLQNGDYSLVKGKGGGLPLFKDE